jgi:hypothetical protein
MNTLEAVEDIRLQNLKLLHGTEGGFGAPTSRAFASYLASKMVVIKQPELSDLYHGKKKIDCFMAQRIENGLGLPPGWLSQDQSFWFSISPKEAEVAQAFSRLPSSVKDHVAAIVHALTNPDAKP